MDSQCFGDLQPQNHQLEVLQNDSPRIFDDFLPNEGLMLDDVNNDCFGGLSNPANEPKDESLDRMQFMHGNNQDF